MHYLEIIHVQSYLHCFVAALAHPVSPAVVDEVDHSIKDMTLQQTRKATKISLVFHFSMEGTHLISIKLFVQALLDYCIGDREAIYMTSNETGHSTMNSST